MHSILALISSLTSTSFSSSSSSSSLRASGSRLASGVRFHRVSPSTWSARSTASSSTSSPPPPPRASTQGSASASASVSWISKMWTSLKANPALASLAAVSLGSALYFYAQNRRLASSAYLIPRVTGSSAPQAPWESSRSSSGSSSSSEEGDGEGNSENNGSGQGWKVLRDEDGEKHLEFNDGKGSQGYFYSRSWGSHTTPDGSVRHFGNLPFGKGSDKCTYDALEHVMDEHMREMDRMFQGFFGGSRDNSMRAGPGPAPGLGGLGPFSSFVPFRGLFEALGGPPLGLFGGGGGGQDDSPLLFQDPNLPSSTQDSTKQRPPSGGRGIRID